MIRPMERFETRRLRFRPPRLEDAETIFVEYAQDPEVTRYLLWKPHRHIEETREFLRRCETVWADGAAFPWVILQKGDNRLIGTLEIEIDGHRAQIGYVLSRSFWGRGYMTEAVTALVGWALAQEGIHRVWACCDIENRASARVLEKSGMRREGVLRRWNLHPNVSDTPRDVYCYAAVESDVPKSD